MNLRALKASLFVSALTFLAFGQTAAQTAAVAQDLREYAGKYGERTVSVESGMLFLQRQGGGRLRLTPVAKDEFEVEILSGARIKFVRGEGAKVVEIQVLNRAGVWEKIAKDTP